MSCLCPTPCTFTEVPLEEISVQWDGPAVGRKALAFPKSKRIFLDRAFWRSVPTVVGRAGLLAHERGHIEGAKCEPCADRRGGEILKRESWPTARDAQVVALSRLQNRDGNKAAADLGQGFGVDDWLQNRERAQGVDQVLQTFLDELAATGLEYGGKTWRLMVGLHGGVRTDSEQFELFKQGRKLNAGADASKPQSWAVVDPKLVVTNASSAKNGKHPLGKAVDVWVVADSGKPLLMPADARAAGVDLDSIYAALGARGQARGLTWGGVWKSFPDKPHFELPDVSPAMALGPADVEGSPLTEGEEDDGGALAVGAIVAVAAAFVVLAA